MIPGQNPQGAVEINTKSVFASTKKGISGEVHCTSRMIGSS